MFPHRIKEYRAPPPKAPRRSSSPSRRRRSSDGLSARDPHARSGGSRTGLRSLSIEMQVGTDRRRSPPPAGASLFPGSTTGCPAAVRCSAFVRPQPRFHIFQADTTPRSEARSGRGYASKKSRIVLQAIVEPIVLGLEPDQYTGRSSVPRDDNLFLHCQAKIPREV